MTRAIPPTVEMTRRYSPLEMTSRRRRLQVLLYSVWRRGAAYSGAGIQPPCRATVGTAKHGEAGLSQTLFQYGNFHSQIKSQVTQGETQCQRVRSTSLIWSMATLSAVWMPYPATRTLQLSPYQSGLSAHCITMCNDRTVAKQSC